MFKKFKKSLNWFLTNKMSAITLKILLMADFFFYFVLFFSKFTSEIWSKDTKIKK